MAQDAAFDQRAAQPSRRTFIVWYLGGLLGAMTLAALAPILVYIAPPPAKGSKKGPQKVKLDTPLSALKSGAALKFDAPKGTAFVMTDGGGDNAPGDLAFGGFLVKEADKVTALAINCSHLGCSIGFNDKAGHFECPCHGSQFSLDGKVLHGPAVFPLSHLKFQNGSTPDEIMIEGLTLGPGG